MTRRARDGRERIAAIQPLVLVPWRQGGELSGYNGDSGVYIAQGQVQGQRGIAARVIGVDLEPDPRFIEDEPSDQPIIVMA